MNSKLTFGYIYDFRNPAQWHRAPAKLYAETLDFITWTESIGFEGAWVAEHHGASDGYIPSPLIVLAAIAARTKTIKLGSVVALGPLYHPVRFAEDCAVLDILSGGRLEMSLGIGYRHRETDSFGIDFTTRGRRLDEFLQIVRRLWAGEAFSFEGRHFTLTNASIMPRPVHGHIPLYLGGFAPKALERAAIYGDGYFGNEEACEPYREKLHAIGKDPASAKIRLQGLMTVVAKDPAQALDELAPYFHHVNNSYGEWAAEDNALGVSDSVTLVPRSLEEFKSSGVLRILTPGPAIDLLTKLRADTGLEHFVMALPPGLPHAQFAKYSQTFAEEIIPAFR